MPMFTPSWKEYEEGIHSEDPELQVKATDKFIEEREKELLVSSTARDWEEGRKKELAKNKPLVVKERLIKEQEKSTLNIKKLKDLGSVKRVIKPAPGYVLIEMEREVEREIGGLILPGSGREPNTGTVLSVGDKLPISGDLVLWPPVEVGKKVLFKRGAGAEIDSENRDCKLMQFSDLLAEIEE